jgi:hypothetical protein
MIEWWIWREWAPLPYKGVVRPQIPQFTEQCRPVGCMDSSVMTPPLYEGDNAEMRELMRLTDNPPPQAIPKYLVDDALLGPPIRRWGLRGFLAPAEEQFTEHMYPAKGCSEVHMIWTDSPCWITCWNDSNAYIKALRQPSIEYIVAQHPWLENDCVMADLVLPVSTRFEMLDRGSDMGSGVFTPVFLEEHCIDPVGESICDFDVVAMITEELGLREEYTQGKTMEEKQLLSFEVSGVEKLTSWEESKDKQYYVIPCDDRVKDVPPGLSGFCDDPERPPVPAWIEKGESHDERLSSERAAKYPLLCMSNQPRWPMHAQGDDITWTREIPTMKLKGPDGYLYERGAVLGGAYVTERLRIRVAYMDHGARWDPIIPSKLDRGGAINTITPHKVTSKRATGMVVSGFLVEVAKVTDEEMAAWRRDYPEAFNRDYDAATGVSLSGWLREE